MTTIAPGCCGLPVAQLLGGDRVGQRAAGVEVGDQHGLVRAQDRGGLGHEVHAAERDHRRVGAAPRSATGRASRRRSRPRPGPRAAGSCGRGSPRRARAASARTSSCRAGMFSSIRGVDGGIGRFMAAAPGSARGRARGREWVSAPTDMKSTPVAATCPDRLERDAAAGLELGAAADALDVVAQLLRGHVVEQDPRRAGRQRLVDLGARRGTRPRAAAPGGARARARTAARDPAGQRRRGSP